MTYDDGEAAAWVERTREVSNEIRHRLADMKNYIPGAYEQLNIEASEFIESLDDETSWFNFASILRSRALSEETADKTFLRFYMEDAPAVTESYSYANTEWHANQVRRMLADYGVTEGSAVALRCVAPEHVFTRNAVLAAGGVVAPLSERYEDGELLPRLDLVGAQAIVTTADLLDQTLRIREELNMQKMMHGPDNISVEPLRIFVIERDEGGRKMTGDALERLQEKCAACPDVYPFLTAMEQYSGAAMPIEPVEKGQAAFSMMTSGSSGVLKEVRIPHSYGLTSHIRSNSWWDVKPDDHVYCTAPPGWMYFYRGLLATEMNGAEFVMGRAHGYSQKAPFLEQVINENDVNVFAGIPSLYRRLLAKEDLDLPSVRRAISTGEPLPLSTVEAFQDITNVSIANCYAATEEGPMIGYPAGLDLPPGYVGIPLPGVDFVMLDGQGYSKGWDRDGYAIISPESGSGPFAIKQTGVSCDYRWPEGAGAVNHAQDHALIHGNLTTGDAVFRDMHDSILFSKEHPYMVEGLQRTDDLIKRYAIQIFPGEINEVIAGHVSGHTVISTFGIPDMDRTNALVSYVEVSPEYWESQGINDLYDMLHNGSLSPIKQPDYIIIAKASAELDSTKVPHREIQKRAHKIVENIREREDPQMQGGIFLVEGFEKSIESLPLSQVDYLEINMLYTKDANRHWHEAEGMSWLDYVTQATEKHPLLDPVLQRDGIIALQEAWAIAQDGMISTIEAGFLRDEIFADGRVTGDELRSLSRLIDQTQDHAPALADCVALALYVHFSTPQDRCADPLIVKKLTRFVEDKLADLEPESAIAFEAMEAFMQEAPLTNRHAGMG